MRLVTKAQETVHLSKASPTRYYAVKGATGWAIVYQEQYAEGQYVLGLGEGFTQGNSVGRDASLTKLLAPPLARGLTVFEFNTFSEMIQYIARTDGD